MKKFLAVLSLLLVALGSMANARGTDERGPKMSSDEFLASLSHQKRQKGAPMRAFSASVDEGLPELFTYESHGQGYLYREDWWRCTFGGAPTDEEKLAILGNSSVPNLNEDGPLALLHCPEADFIARVKKEPYQDLILAYALADQPEVEVGGVSYKATLSTWPLLNSPGYGNSVFEAAYVIVENQRDGITLIHNGVEAIIQMSPEKLFELTGWAMEDLSCGAEVVSLMIPLNRTGRYPGETGDAFVSTVFGALLKGEVVPDIDKKVRLEERCHRGLYQPLLPVFNSGGNGSS